MHPNIQRFCNYLKDSLDQVRRREWCLFLVLCALRSLVRPYWGITHDAKLYALQVMNRVSGGFFDQDLFLLHGSQDSYSIFSILMAPVASRLGLDWSFFLVYVASTALLIFAEIRLVRALVPDRLAADAALVLMTVSGLPWGSWGVLHVHESFLTPRLPAIALVLLGLERLLRRRHAGGLLLMSLAMAFHPLMAIGGLLLAVACTCVAKLSLRAVLTIGFATVAASAVVLLYQPLGTRLFGYVDPQWHDIVRRRNPYSFPATWSAADWWWIAYSLAVVVAACRYLDGYRGIVLRLAILLALAGVMGSVAAETYPYALLLQGQPYRAVWLLQTLAVPLGVLVMLRLWQQGTVPARLTSAFVLCFTGRVLVPGGMTAMPITSTLTIWLALFVLFAIIFSRMERRDRPGTAVRAAWLCPSVLASLAATAVALSLINALGFCLGGLVRANPVLLWLAPSRCGDAVVALAGVLLIAGLWSAAKGIRRTGFAAAAVWVGLSGAAFLLRDGLDPWSCFIKDPADVRYVRQFVREHWQDRGRAPRVYWPINPVHVWFEIPADSFYSWNQTAGVVFSRGTAIEGQRRALLARRFEILEMRAIYDPDTFWDFYAAFYQATLDEPGPTRQDLVTLCREEQLDFVVLPCAFKDLVAGTNGTVFLYDCRSIQAREVAGKDHGDLAMGR